MFSWLKAIFSHKPKNNQPQVVVSTDRVSGNAESTDEAFALKNKGNAYLSVGNHIDAEKCYQAALEIDPRYAQARNNLGYVFRASGNFSAAQACAERAVALKPDLAEAYVLLSDLAMDNRRITESLKYITQALVCKPDHLGFRCRLANIQFELGMEACLMNFREIIKLDPKIKGIFSDFFFALTHFESITPTYLYEEHLKFGQLFENSAVWHQHKNSRILGRKLKIGFVSGDLRQHAVAIFIEPILERLCLNQSFSLFAYHTSTKEDEVSQRLKASFSVWENVAVWNDDLLIQQIMQDEIDILIDLSGHTENNRLLAFAKKPAPIQISWIGYPGTSGLLAMDYYLGDRHFLPSELFEQQFTEKFAYLPASVSFLPFEGDLETNELPALQNGYFTFGSFNRINKLNASVISLWARLLKALPDSQIILGAMPDKDEFNPVIDWFANEGIDPGRIHMYSRRGMRAYLKLHHQVDMCLDTFPYTGGTTTNHALLMGVPTLTITGQTPAGRQGVSILLPVGLEAFVTNDKDDFIKKGLMWAENLTELAGIRKGLRTRCANTPCRDPQVITDSLAKAFQIMWQRWCLNLPTESFDVAPDTELIHIQASSGSLTTTREI